MINSYSDPACNSLESMPPVPTLQLGKHPLHTFLGYSLAQHVLSMSIRDPNDDREMPPNGNGHVSANCFRGVRKACLSRKLSVVYILLKKISYVGNITGVAFICVGLQTRCRVSAI
jgi:hypothetical protein